MTNGLHKPYAVGRPPLDLGEIIFCSALKVYSTLSSRRTVSNYRTALDRGYLSKVPNFNAVSGFLNKDDTIILLTQLIELSSLPLKNIEKDFTIDSFWFHYITLFKMA